MNSYNRLIYKIFNIWYVLAHNDFYSVQIVVIVGATVFVKEFTSYL
jgi:hypothetical protein